MSNPLTTHLNVAICQDASDAIRQGFLYRPPVYKPIEVKQVVVVKSGMQSGKSSVEFVLEDEKGQKYVLIMTGALLRNIPTEF